MMEFVKRNAKLYYRDKGAVFFSLLSVLIIIGLFVIFLQDMLAANMRELPNARTVIDAWLVAGLLAVVPLTTTMGSIGIMVDDQEKKIAKDFFTAPIKRGTIASAYVGSTAIVGLVMSIIALVLSQGYVWMGSGHFFSVKTISMAVGLIGLTVFASCAFSLLIITFIKTQNAFSSINTVIGTLIGFLTGIYVPIGSFPDAVQWLIKLFPISHAAMLFRRVFMEQPLAEAFLGIPDENRLFFETFFGVTYTIGEHSMDTGVSILYILATSIIFYALAVVRIARKRRS